MDGPSNLAKMAMQHSVLQAQAACIAFEATDTNLADVCTKVLGQNEREDHVKTVLLMPSNKIT